MRLLARRQLKRGSAIAIALVMVLAVPSIVVAQTPVASPSATNLPVIELDVLDGFVWSSDHLFVVPGQRMIVTNRDVDRHTFTVDEWNLDVNLPSLQPVEINVPIDATIGQTLVFYSSVGSDREQGLEGELTVVTAEQLAEGPGLLVQQTPTAERLRIFTRDNFTFEPAVVNLSPGSIFEVVNDGVIEHHFVVDAWGVNETIAPGGLALVRVPEDAALGSAIDFYCSVPGHEQQGMVGVIRIQGQTSEVSTVVRTAGGGSTATMDLRPFLPTDSFLGTDWARLRSGSSESLLGNRELNGQVFPYSGVGAVYLGPLGSRVTVVVMPLRTQGLPVNQVTEAVTQVQDIMTNTWTIDRLSSAAWRSVASPPGCNVSSRTTGIVPVTTVEAGITSCQLHGIGVAIFVSVEGEFAGMDGVRGSDLLMGMIVTGETQNKEER